VVDETDFFYEDGYDLTWPPAAEWYLDAVRTAAMEGRWSDYGSTGFDCGLPPQRSFVQPIPFGEVKWGAIYMSMTSEDDFDVEELEERESQVR